MSTDIRHLRDAIYNVGQRIDQCAAMSKLIARASDDPLTTDAVFGIGETLTEIAATLDGIASEGAPDA